MKSHVIAKASLENEVEGFGLRMTWKQGGLTAIAELTETLEDEDLEHFASSHNSGSVDEFRQIMQTPYADLSGEDFTDCDLKELDWSGVILEMADLSGSNLSKGRFRGADLTFADLHSANLQDCDMSYAELCKTDFTGCDLRGALLNGCDLHGASLVEADLRGASLAGVLNYDRANFQGSRFDHKTLLPFSWEEAKERGMINESPKALQ